MAKVVTSDRRPSAFRIADHCAGAAMVACLPAQRAAVHVDGPWGTWMYETRNETATCPPVRGPPSRSLALSCRIDLPPAS
jgi:hypothetical protein